VLTAASTAALVEGLLRPGSADKLLLNQNQVCSMLDLRDEGRLLDRDGAPAADGGQGPFFWSYEAGDDFELLLPTGEGLSLGGGDKLRIPSTDSLCRPTLRAGCPCAARPRALGKAAPKPRPGDLCPKCTFTPSDAVPLPDEDGGESSSAAEPPQTLRVVRVDGQELSLGQARLLSGKRGTFAEVVSMLLRKNPKFPLYFQPELPGTSGSALELPPGVEGVSHAGRCFAYAGDDGCQVKGLMEGATFGAAFLCGRRGPRATGEGGETSCNAVALVLAQPGVHDRLIVKLLGTHLHEAGPCCVHAAADCEACVQAGLLPRPTPSAGLHGSGLLAALQLFDAKLLLSGKATSTPQNLYRTALLRCPAAVLSRSFCLCGDSAHNWSRILSSEAERTRDRDAGLWAGASGAAAAAVAAEAAEPLELLLSKLVSLALSPLRLSSLTPPAHQYAIARSHAEPPGKENCGRVMGISMFPELQLALSSHTQLSIYKLLQTGCKDYICHLDGTGDVCNRKEVRARVCGMEPSASS